MPITRKSSNSRICIVLGNPPSPSETFVQAHIEQLPGRIEVAYGSFPTLNGKPLRSPSLVARAGRKLVRLVRGQDWQAEVTAGYLKAFRKCRPDAVLAEYGDNAVTVTDACRKAQIPLIVHFHGYDVSLHECLRSMKLLYPALFRDAAALIAVSKAMRAKLIDLGAPAEKVHWNPYGVDVRKFQGANPASSLPIFLAVGRFVEKKAPQLTIRAFSKVCRQCPGVRLRMVGFGPLEEQCKALTVELGIADAVDFLGTCAPDVVQCEMRRARCFVQHSIEAADGDSEGTPVAILEAGASALPVVSTRHAGIPDVVIEGETGFLVAERDVDGMAEYMVRLARDPELARTMGLASRARIESEFSMETSIEKLWSIIESCIQYSADEFIAV